MVLPLLIVAVMGVIDVGRLIYAHVTVQEATQEGAFFAAYNPTPCNTITTRLKSSAPGNDWVTDAAVEVEYTAGTPGRILVMTRYPLDLITPIVPGILGADTITIGADITATNFSSTTLPLSGCTNP
jgi:Flp pilus assembly protein TadG